MHSKNKMHKSFNIHLTGLRIRSEEVSLSFTHTRHKHRAMKQCVSSEGIVERKPLELFPCGQTPTTKFLTDVVAFENRENLLSSLKEKKTATFILC